MRFAPTLGAAKGETVIKLDIINEVVNKTGITKTKAEMTVETVFESMKRALSHGERIELRGFGIFNVRPRKTGIGRNPRAESLVQFSARYHFDWPLGIALAAARADPLHYHAGRRGTHPCLPDQPAGVPGSIPERLRHTTGQTASPSRWPSLFYYA